MAPDADEMRRELTDETLAHVRGYASTLLARLYRADPRAADELVERAILDTLRGVTPWRPADRSLRRHLCRVVYARALAAEELGDAANAG
jgi:hypothetical protein